MMRARLPDISGTVARDGATIGYEVFGEGPTTVLLLPTWTIIHSRFWKMQVPYLARHYRVITYDGPGNGRSDRVTDPERYGVDAYVADAIAVLDACDVESVIVVGLSMGAQYGSRLAWLAPERVDGLVLIGPALPLAPNPERSAIGEMFFEPYPEHPRGWEKYNLAYWHDHYEDFTRFFFRQAFHESHSTKAREDAVGWAAQTGPAILEAEARRPPVGIGGSRASVIASDDVVAAWSKMLRELTCPVLVVHGTDDRIQAHAVGVEAARITGGTLVSFAGSGHLPNVREPVKFNLLLRDFIERTAS